MGAVHDTPGTHARPKPSLLYSLVKFCMPRKQNWQRLTDPTESSDPPSVPAVPSGSSQVIETSPVI